MNNCYLEALQGCQIAGTAPAKAKTGREAETRELNSGYLRGVTSLKAGYAGDVDVRNGLQFFVFVLPAYYTQEIELAWRFSYENKQTVVNRFTGMSHR